MVSNKNKFIFNYFEVFALHCLKTIVTPGNKSQLNLFSLVHKLSKTFLKLNVSPKQMIWWTLSPKGNLQRAFHIFSNFSASSMIISQIFSKSWSSQLIVWYRGTSNRLWSRRSVWFRSHDGTYLNIILYFCLSNSYIPPMFMGAGEPIDIHASKPS